MVTVIKDGQETKMLIEAVPRYSKVNFYQENGCSEKREQFLREAPVSANITLTKGKEKELAEKQGKRMRRDEVN